MIQQRTMPAAPAVQSIVLSAVALALAALLLLAGQAHAQIVHAVDGAHGQAYVDHVSKKALEFTEATGIQVNIMTASGHREQIAVWAAGGALPDAIDIVSDNGLSFAQEQLNAVFRELAAL